MSLDGLDVYNEASDAANDEAVVLHGELTAENPGKDVPEFDTLSEPIKETIFRDVRAVAQKFRHVIVPKEKKSLLSDWDLWGPLIVCTYMAFLLENTQETDGGPAFAEFFALAWVGAFIVTLNNKLLGGHISFFQSACVIGYCLFPLSVSLTACKVIVAVFSEQTTVLFIVRAIIVVVAYGWSSYASMQFLGDCQPPKRKALAAYPLFLFYFVIAWMVLSDTD